MRAKQPYSVKLLFVCSINRVRSLTAEVIFENVPGYEVRSAGTQPNARIVVTEGAIRWADYIFAMEKSHLSKLKERFPEALEGKKIVALHIPDDYYFLQPELKDELRAKVAQYVDLGDGEAKD